MKCHVEPLVSYRFKNYGVHRPTLSPTTAIVGKLPAAVQMIGPEDKVETTKMLFSSLTIYPTQSTAAIALPSLLRSALEKVYQIHHNKRAQ